MPVSNEGNPTRHLYLAGLFIICGFIAYANILTSYFLSDDFDQIGKVLRGDLSVTWGQSHGGFFRPIFILSYWVDAKLWGAYPLGFHLTNVALHSANAFLVFLLALRLAPELRPNVGTRKVIALSAALLFLSHPSHTEAVSWISGRADLLATLFALLSLLWFLAYAESNRTISLVLSSLSFLLALSAKESAICLPFLILAIALARQFARRDSIRPRQFVKATSPFFMILLVFVLLRWFFIGSLVGGYGTAQHLNFSPAWIRDRLLQAELRLIVPALPWQWSGVLLKPLQSGRFIVTASFFTVVIAIAIGLRHKYCARQERGRENRQLLLLVLLFLISLLPVINLRLSLFDTQGERFVYLPSVFVCVLISLMTAILIRHFRVWLIVIVAVLCFYSLRLYQTNQIWRAAAEMSRSFRDELVNSATHDQLVILNAPDNLKGVPVYHNGLGDALKFFQSQKHLADVQLVSLHNLQTTSDELELLQSSELARLRLLNPEDGFIEAHDAGCAQVVRQTKTSLEIKLESCSANTDIFAWSGGRIIRVVSR